MARLDPHSFVDSEQPQTASLHWEALVDFEARVLRGSVTLTFKTPGSGPLDLDTRGLTVEAVTCAGSPVPHALSEPDPVLGSRLRVELPPGSTAVRVDYRTSPDASALQWLEPAQTAGGKRPYLFSQCQAIHARSVLPLQDTPLCRVTYTAELTIPRDLRALMAAASEGRVERGGEVIEKFRMPQPIPPYLIALAVGDLVSRDLGARSRVWAEPSVVESAASEFADIDRMMAAGERLFGPYDWDRFDVLVMPPSFPYGGMENPRLTFVTPTLLVGDRSQVRVVAHELAHSWTGNLITNANAEHFWLNEGWTRYAELRIVEALEGEEATALHAALGMRSCERAVADFIAQGRPELTRLKTELNGIDPDDAFSVIPYDKGCLLIRALEAQVGRERFDRFVRAYIDAFRFASITTEAFREFTERELPGALAAVGADAYLFGPGLPPGAPQVRSSRLELVTTLGASAPSDELARSMSPTEWELYLESLPSPVPLELCRSLDERFRLTEAKNFEILVAWLQVALAAGHEPALPRAEALLSQVGRMKYLKPLYRSLLQRPATVPVAQRAFERSAPGYHPIARAVIQAMIKSAS